MSLTTRARRFVMLAALAVTTATLDGATASPAQAGGEPYLGWDFGGGLGVGIGTPPSAYDPCPTYGWPVYPYYGCRHYRPVYHYRYYRRHHRPRHYYR